MWIVERLVNFSVNWVRGFGSEGKVKVGIDLKLKCFLFIRSIFDLISCLIFPRT